MPKYQFFCPECNIRFERTLKMGMHPTHLCPECKDEVPRVWDASTGFAVSFEAGANAGNSGVHKVDYPSADTAVGRSSEKRWQEYHSRDEVKRKVREQGGTHALTRIDGDGYVDYSPLPSEGIQNRKMLVHDATRVMRAEGTSKA